jgi:transposase InsO family protein
MLLDRQSWPPRDMLASAPCEDIEAWYNRPARHSTLDYVRPVEYEDRHTQPLADDAA